MVGLVLLPGYLRLERCPPVCTPHLGDEAHNYTTKFHEIPSDFA